MITPLTDVPNGPVDGAAVAAAWATIGLADTTDAGARVASGAMTVDAVEMTWAVLFNPPSGDEIVLRSTAVGEDAVPRRMAVPSPLENRTVRLGG